MSDHVTDEAITEAVENSEVVAASLRLGHGFHADELDRAIYHLQRLDHRLNGMDPERVELHLAVKDRAKVEQKVVLEAHLPDVGHLVATTKGEQLWAAVDESRDELLRQLNDARDRHDPKHQHRNH